MPIRFVAHALSIAAALGAATALCAPAAAQQTSGLPPLAPMSAAERQSLPPEYRTGPVTTNGAQTTMGADGVETITRTRRIDAPRPPMAAPSAGFTPTKAPAPQYCQMMDCGASSAVFSREQWLAECERRTRGRGNDETGTIILGLLGGIAGGFLGYEIAGAGDRVLGAALGAGGGGLLGGLIGSLFGDDEDERYDCAAALDSYLSQAPLRVASRGIPAPVYAAPSYGYGYPAQYAYAPPPQMVMVPVQSQMQQQVVVRETVREETYSVPGAARVIPAPVPVPAPKMIKLR